MVLVIILNVKFSTVSVLLHRLKGSYFLIKITHILINNTIKLNFWKTFSTNLTNAVPF